MQWMMELKKAFFPEAADDVLSMNGTTTGGMYGSVIYS
jgi:hypothetical protein